MRFCDAPPTSFSRRKSLALLAAFGLALLASTGCSTAPLVEGVDASGRALILLVDTSASMKDNDPDRAAHAGAAVALGLAGTRDNVGLISFGTAAEVVIPLRPAGGAAPREQAREAIASLGRGGSTDFEGALDTAFAMLDEGRAPAGASAIILTDGIPTGKVTRGRGEFARREARPLGVPAAVGKFASRGWRIFAISFGPEAPLARGYLVPLVTPTGGAVFEAKDASGLVAAFKDVSVQALGYLTASPSSEAFSVVPETRRLAVVGGTLARDDGPLGNTIALAAASGAPSVTLVEDPDAGKYRGDGLVLLEPGWGVDLEPNSPPTTIESGARIDVVARVKGDARALERIKGKVTGELEVKRQDEVVARGPLVGTDRFVGAFVAPQGEEPVTLTVALTVAEGGRSFTSRRSLTLVLKKGTGKPAPAAVLSLDTSPSRVELVGFPEEELRASVTVTGDAKNALAVAVSGLKSDKLQLAPGGRATIELRFPGSASGGTLSFEGRSEGAAPVRRDVPVSVRRGVFSTTAIDLGSLKPGEKKTQRVEARDVSLRIDPLKGPAGTLAVKATSDSLEVVVPADAAPGRYEGILVARCGSSEKKAPVLLEVARRGPDKLAIAATWGTAKIRFELSGEEAVLTPGELILEGSGARIDPDLDMKTERLEDGSYELRVHAAATLPPGKYKGVLQARQGETVTPIAIVLEVKR